MHLLRLQALAVLLILLINDIILVWVGFGVAQAYYAVSSSHGHVSVNRALHVYQHTYSKPLWWFSRWGHVLVSAAHVSILFSAAHVSVMVQAPCKDRNFASCMQGVCDVLCILQGRLPT